MVILIATLLATCAALLAIPALIFSFEVVAGVVGGRPRPSDRTCIPRDRVAIIIPAHNEGLGLLPTIDDVRKQLRSGDRVLVIADNCSDDTAAVAAASGAEVIARNDLTKIGKGYALEFGLRHLDNDPPAVVIIIDADCRIADETIDRLSAACAEMQRPAQALNLMTAPMGSIVNYQVAEFAWRVKNWVRPLGLATLGLPCQLMGTGMAFPWDIIQSAEVGTGFIVEDLKLSLDLALAGTAPIFCPSAKVVSSFPTHQTGAEDQRQRWESGHLDLIFRLAPRMLWEAVRHRNLSLFVLTLDLLVPPLSLLVLLLSAMCLSTGVATLFGIPSPALVLSVASLLVFMTATGAAWYRYGRDLLPFQGLPKMVSYLIAKIRIYRYIFRGRSPTHWVRADRTKSKSTGSTDFHQS
jgi:glycosyltransferase involved in cell wall biosynthesis